MSYDQSTDEMFHQAQQPTKYIKPRTKYFTQGELLPWKGRWLRLENVDTSTGHLTFSPVGETTGELKRKLAEEKGLKNHPSVKEKT